MVQIDFCEKHGPDSIFFEIDECNDCNWIIPAIRRSAPKGTRVYHGVKSSGTVPSIVMRTKKARERKKAK